MYASIPWEGAVSKSLWRNLIGVPIVVFLIFLTMPELGRDPRGILFLAGVAIFVISLQLAPLVWIAWISARKRAHPERYDQDRYRP
jgi:hypothetical protein